MRFFDKGIILAGGNGTRLDPLTLVCCKQLLPVYDRPMVMYPLQTLLNAGIRDILIITRPQDAFAFNVLLGNGTAFGCSIRYAVQDEPRGIAEAFLIGKDFIGRDNVALILGDNLFFDIQLPAAIARAQRCKLGATIFAKPMHDPRRFGVVEICKCCGRPKSIVEKPATTQSGLAVTGLYFYDNKVVQFAEGLQPSDRGELEITDINRVYLRHKQLAVETLTPEWVPAADSKWYDCGTISALADAANYCRRHSLGATGSSGSSSNSQTCIPSCCSRRESSGCDCVAQ